MSNLSFLIWLCLLTAAVATLFWLLHGGTDAPSIGGGGYDLGPFLYSWLLVLLSGVWTLGALMAGIATRDRSAAKRGFALAGLGLASLALALALHGQNLS